jgi:leucyl aminopeptidase
MEISTTFDPPAQVGCDWLAVGVWENEPLPASLAELDFRIDGQISRLMEKQDIQGKPKELTPIHHGRGIGAERVLVVGLGQKPHADRAALWTAGAASARLITKKQYERVAWLLPSDVPNLDEEAVAVAMGCGFRHGMEGPGLRKNKLDRFAPRELCLFTSPAVELRNALRRVDVEGRAVSLARELVNLPPNELYPETFAARARDVAQHTGMECTIFDEKELARENMNALLGVAQGSERPPRLVMLRYRRVREGKLLALVGKGVTFDSGGLSLKPTEGMVDMKCDMAGAAAVLAAMQAIAELGLPVNLIGLMPLVENMPSGKSLKLGDVLRARNGKTIEILNTDAEGRLILADALAYAVEMGAENIIDLATLTGACVVALGTEVAGMMTNNEAWSLRVLESARNAGEKAWPLPMFPLYAEMIRSDVADIKNTGGSRWAGAISAAKFLEEFVGNTPWVHLDIAGPAFAEKENAVRDAGGTGCFVRTLIDVARSYNV